MDARWYEVVPCGSPGAWVTEHVIPMFGKTTIPYRDIQKQACKRGSRSLIHACILLPTGQRIYGTFVMLLLLGQVCD